MMKAELERDLERQMNELLAKADIDSPNGRRGQAIFYMVYLARQGRLAKYTLASVLVLAAASIANLAVAVIALFK